MTALKPGVNLPLKEKKKPQKIPRLVLFLSLPLALSVPFMEISL